MSDIPPSPEKEDSSWARYELRVVEAKSELSKVYCEWDPLADQAEELCRTLYQYFVRVRRDVNISRITGSAVSLGIGLPIIVAGIITTPFTFGASSLLIGVGAGVSATGGLVAGGASLTEFGIRRMKMKDVKELNDRLKDLTRSLMEAKLKLEAVLLESLRFFAKQDSLPQSDQVKETVVAAGQLSRMAISVGGVALRLALENGDDALKLIFASSEVGRAMGTTAARVLLNSTFAAAAAVIDIYTIVDSAINMSKDGNRYKVVSDLEETIENLLQLRRDVRALNHRADGVIRKDSKNILSIAQDAFRCCVCLDVSHPPMIQCPAEDCRALLGCESCINKWIEDKGTCPKCRGFWPSNGVSRQQFVHGCSELLDQLRRFEDQK